MNDETTYDIAVIGGGPTGLFGLFYAGLRGMTSILFESLPELGGQLTTLYPEKLVFDMPGFPQVLARDLAAELVKQAARFSPVIRTSEQVQLLRKQAERRFELATTKGTYQARSVLISAGVGSFAPKKLAINLDHYERRGLYYFVKDTNEFAGKRILIVGGGDSALDWALHLEPVGSQVSLAHRRGEFRGHEDSAQKVLASTVDVRLFHEVKEVQGDGCVERVVIYDNRTRAETTLDVDCLLLNLGFAANLGPIRDWGIELAGKAIRVDGHFQTSVQGVFAAGDIVEYPDRENVNLIATGVADAAVAVNYAKAYIEPGARVTPGHSSSRTDL
jgi:ferredoxin/flavodoxin---NADP+ reductase